MLAFLLLRVSFAETNLAAPIIHSESIEKIDSEIDANGIRSALLSSKNGEGKKTKKKKKKIFSVPIEVGVGPAAYHFGASNGIDRIFHTGISLSGQAVISNKLIRENKHMIPKQYRKMALAQDEIRVSKIWIPESIIISPSTSGTAAFGASFRPIAASLIQAKNSNGLSVDLGARATYVHIQHGDGDLSPHFLGLGVDATAEYRICLKKGELKGRWLGIGWASHVYIPQGLLFSSDSAAALSFEPAQWHTGQAFIKYYHRFPYQYKS